MRSGLSILIMISAPFSESLCAAALKAGFEGHNKYCEHSWKLVPINRWLMVGGLAT
jgi:hypothetical protein